MKQKAYVTKDRVISLDMNFAYFGGNSAFRWIGRGLFAAIDQTAMQG
jgi:hypothetical protein